MEPTQSGWARDHMLLLGGMFALVLAVLLIGYFLFGRPEYVVLAQDLRPADASAVVAELDKRGVSYLLRNGGSTILVPENQANATRVAIAGSDAAARGQIGFELFNKSDMGLTNFAQKINYQRALQGELVRTIMAMDGVESARVHLALPEKALFRGDRVEPRAAVTIAMKPGQTADPARVVGIQQLVAAAVPDLPDARVVVLDASGHVISAAPAPGVTNLGPGMERPADIEERAAIENYYRARARGAIERQMPGLRFSLRVLVFPSASGPETAAGDAAAPAGWAPSGEGAQRNFRVRMVFVSLAPLGSEDQQVARAAIMQAAGMSDPAGDSLSFETGPVDAAVAAPAMQQHPVTPVAAPPATASVSKTPAGFSWPPVWMWIVAAVAIAAVLVWRFRGHGTRLDPEVHDAFAQRLRRQLNLAEEGDDAVA
ncbi:flagellar basal-body MS-ring/collar protein FliF [Sphingomonas sp. NIBR02145]|uniref:flagellar basal-body MS-ring/collar protein FliF n=1 Tax=Sphingomonas sp. NIBR02145 TaxID=3014784 RepID=UPI0022B4BE43|nr:flagellar basal-body MS-ring/collar protein FliF [Sphingomonas sp. NIBR02145]WHU05004.1 flagellar basal-body MS-ring/collar protein FliF [Sphingomonas sp. NIBR02145]